jgi:hypothetical protein
LVSERETDSFEGRRTSSQGEALRQADERRTQSRKKKKATDLEQQVVERGNLQGRASVFRRRWR